MARDIKELEISIPCTLAALHIAGECNAVADALSRFELHARARDLSPTRQLREKFGEDGSCEERRDGRRRDGA